MSELQTQREIVTSSRDFFAQATELHKAGKIDAALALFAKIAGREPTNSAALHWVGYLHNQRGEHDRAVEYLKRAIIERPGIPAFHLTLAESFRNLGQLKRAIGCCETALRLNPDYPEALCTLGLAIHGSGRPGEAVAHFRRALELRPDFAQAHRDLAIVLRELGQSEEALEHLRRAVELAPRYAAARSGLTLVLLDHGQAEEALVHSQEAVRLQPDLAIHHHNLGNVLQRLKRCTEARGAYLEALRLDPNLAHSHLQIGITLRIDGQLAEAEPWFKNAVDLDPENAWFWEQLADLQMERQEHGAAIPCWERAIELSAKERAGLHISLGWSLQESGRLAEAVDQYRTAERLQPEAVMAQINLGGIHEELGEMTAAEAAYRTAASVQPRFGLAHARLGTLLRGQLPDADLAAIEERLAEPETSSSARARLLFALSLVLDARNDYQRAAECSRQANALNMELARGTRGYTPELHVQYVDSVVRGFTAELFERLAGAGSLDIRPVFVFGLPRSGTTLVEQILASHSQIFGAGELRFTRQSFDAIPSVLDVPGPAFENINGLTPDAIGRLAKHHLHRLENLAQGHAALRIVDKMPDNYIYLGLLAAMFPDAVFIHCRRDLRDVALSCWITDFRPENIPWASDPSYIGSRFDQYLRLMNHWRSVLPVPIHEVNYEDTVADLDMVAKCLLSACGLEYEPGCLDFHRTRRRVKTASVGQVRQPIYSRSVGRWKNYESELPFLFQSVPVNDPDSHSRVNGAAHRTGLRSVSVGDAASQSSDRFRQGNRTEGRRTESSVTLERQEV
jgi:tetratricopeptide (TPR) repeat protein